MTETDTALLPVQIEKYEPTSPASPSMHGGERKRLQVATEHFAVGTTANTVCEKVMEKYGAGNMGLWLLQMKADKSSDESSGSEDAGYITVKDSKYELKEGVDYYVIEFKGSGMFLYS